MISRSGEFAIAASAVVVAACAVVLTVKDLSSSAQPVVARQEMTFNSEALAAQVRKTLSERPGMSGVIEDMTCPEDVAIRTGNAFGCSVVHEGRLKTVRVVVTDAEAAKIQVGKPES